MPRFERGAVVTRGGRFGVVWLDAETGLVLFPIERGDVRPHDVLIEDTMSCGFAMIEARVRARRLPPLGRTGQVQVGTMPPLLMCRLMGALARFEANEAIIAKWAPAEIHRRRAIAENLPATR